MRLATARRRSAAQLHLPMLRPGFNVRQNSVVRPERAGDRPAAGPWAAMRWDEDGNPLITPAACRWTRARPAPAAVRRWVRARTRTALSTAVAWARSRAAVLGVGCGGQCPGDYSTAVGTQSEAREPAARQWVNPALLGRGEHVGRRRDLRPDRDRSQRYGFVGVRQRRLATGEYATAIGWNSWSSGDSSTSLGESAFATADGATALRGRQCRCAEQRGAGRRL
ncbi:hypothetical protein [Luteimonas mephitis]|uniref:hypothetical protein n=1 Tax=Luteimonas mephitis TaxID=83615 RepID=UPI003A92E219